MTARLTKISVSGIAFALDPSAETLPEGAPLENLRVHLGPCVFPGSGTVLNVTPGDGDEAEFGCLFYPATTEVEDRLMALVVGMELGGAKPGADG